MSENVINGHKFIPRQQRRKMERLQEEAGKVYETFRNSFIEFLMVDQELQPELIEARIHMYHVKWKTYCTLKGFGENVRDLVKNQLESIYEVYKTNLNNHGKEESNKQVG